jgi:hypothetical protein
MSDQTVKHDNSLPGFLLILLPAAFVAVFLSIAWPFIVGAILFLTGNNVWQSYQWAKLSQQVNPYFSQMVLEQQGEIAPLALSARANISAPVADRYLQGKAAEIGGVSYRSDSGSTVYSFLTVNSLENTFAGLSTNESVSQKLATLDYVVVDAETSPISATVEKSFEQSAPILEQPVAVPLVSEVIANTPVVVESAILAETPATADIPTDSIAIKVVESVAPAATLVATGAVTPTVVESITPTELVVRVVADPAPPSRVAVKTTEETTSGSTFAQALRGIFNTEHDPVAEAGIELEPVSSAEAINQADLAKRLDVHPSTLYKRRSDVSFSEWTRNRDPEGVAWGYQRDTKEFYRLA